MFGIGGHQFFFKTKQKSSPNPKIGIKIKQNKRFIDIRNNKVAFF